jgi:hypothetical protein
VILAISILLKVHLYHLTPRESPGESGLAFKTLTSKLYDKLKRAYFSVGGVFSEAPSRRSKFEAREMK